MHCPYCSGTKIIKKGQRTKKYETVQLFYCKHCQRKFTPAIHRSKTYPLRIILDSLTLYNRFHTLKEAARLVSEKYGLAVSPQNISNWLASFADYLPFLRMREFLVRKRGPTLSSTEKDTSSSAEIVQTRLFHQQIYDFKYHRAKCELILEEEFRHYKFRPLQEFLELCLAECPHSIFRQSQTRASEFKGVFNLDKVRITSKQNAAIKIARLVMQAVANNKLRHQTLQEFMLINDSVTVAVEVPVLLDEEDLEHYRNELGFQIPKELSNQFSSTNFQSNLNDSMTNENLDIENSMKIENSKIENCPVITGHIDLLQVRNGAIHIMDFKPSARKVKPVDQLTLYALAMSRLTGIRLFHFRCAWFDEEDYFEFFPLHVVYKKKKRKKRNRV